MRENTAKILAKGKSTDELSTHLYRNYLILDIIY